MPEDRSMQLDGRIALAAGLLLTALLLVTNNVISRVPLADYLLALALIGIGLALIFVRWTPRQSDAETETVAPQSHLAVVSAPATEPLPEWTPTSEAETPTVVAAPVEPLPNVDTLTLPKIDSTTEDDETQAVESVEVEEATQAVERVEVADETQAVESVEVEEATQAVEPVEPDDLEKINGIGPKIAAALRDLGIVTFAALAQADEKQLQGALEAAGARRLGDPGFWIRQAEYAARGDWDGMQRAIDAYKAQRGDGS